MSLVLAIAASGCVPPPAVTLTGSKLPPRPAGCAFQILASPPDGPYSQVAIIDLPFSPAALDSVHTAAELYYRVAEVVCETGGDAVVGTINGMGVYIQAAVLRVGLPESASGAGPTVAPAEEGCTFDAECKGDRICVHRECVAPASAK